MTIPKHPKIFGENIIFEKKMKKSSLCMLQGNFSFVLYMSAVKHDVDMVNKFSLG